MYSVMMIVMKEDVSAKYTRSFDNLTDFRERDWMLHHPNVLVRAAAATTTTKMDMAAFRSMAALQRSVSQ